ncbi:hypothetical protein JHK85_000730 [Glycine max]|nr:hypothetical protein JHK85_000730 [Glycine max]
MNVCYTVLAKDQTNYARSCRDANPEVVCIMLCLLTHALAAALKEGRNSLVSEFFYFLTDLKGTIEQTTTMPLAS